MDFKIEKKKNSNFKKYQYEDLDIALAFSKKAAVEFKEFLKGIILFGSSARNLNRGTPSKEGDVDILIILDDIQIILSPEIIEAYKIISQKIINTISPRIHVTTLKYTTFWDMVRNGDPIGINFLRDGVPIVDTGFFEPLQALLLRGQIRPTYESMWTYFNRAPDSLNYSRAQLIKAVIDLYWAVTDSSHAVLIKFGCVPTTPKHMGDLLEKKVLPSNKISKKDCDTVRFFYKLNKEIEHRLISDISGQEYESYYNKAKLFVEKMRSIIADD